MAATLARCVAQLSAADEASGQAAAVVFAQARPRAPFSIKQVSEGELLLPKASKELQTALQSDARPRDVFIALRALPEPGAQADQAQALEAEVNSLMGAAAELRGQVQEVQHGGFVDERVEDAVQPEVEDEKEAAARVAEMREEVARKQQQLQYVEEQLMAARARKRGAHDEGGAESPSRQLRRLERALVDSNVAEAQSEAAVELSAQRLRQASSQRNAKQQELDRLRAHMLSLTAEAEEALQTDPDFRQTCKEGERLRQEITAAEAQAHALSRDAEALAAALVKVTTEMAQQGSAQAVVLAATRSAANGALPLQDLKEHVAGELAKLKGSSESEAAISQQVLEAIYSLVSASLISIDRASPQQTVSVILP